MATQFTDTRCLYSQSTWNLNANPRGPNWYDMLYFAWIAQRTHDAIITLSLHRNDIATPFLRNNDVIIAPHVRWEGLVYQKTLQWNNPSISGATQIRTFLKLCRLSVKLGSESFVSENEWTWKYLQTRGLYSGPSSLKTRVVILPTWSSLVTPWIAVTVTCGDDSRDHNNTGICFQ